MVFLQKVTVRCAWAIPVLVIGAVFALPVPLAQAANAYEITLPWSVSDDADSDRTPAEIIQSLVSEQATAARNDNLQARLNWLGQNVAPAPVPFSPPGLVTLTTHGALEGIVGTDPTIAPSRDGNVLARLNWLTRGVDDLYEKYATATALAASLQDPYVPAGQRGSFSIATAAYGRTSALSFGLASIVGTRGRLSLAAAISEESDASLYRLGYTLSW